MKSGYNMLGQKAYGSIWLSGHYCLGAVTVLDRYLFFSLRTWVLVRMVFEGHLTICLLQLCISSRGCYSQNIWRGRKRDGGRHKRKAGKGHSHTPYSHSRDYSQSMVNGQLSEPFKKGSKWFRNITELRPTVSQGAVWNNIAYACVVKGQLLKIRTVKGQNY